MGGDKEAHDRPCWGERHRKTIVEIAHGSAFRMGHLCLRRGLQSCLDLWQIEPAILFAPPNHSTLAREDLLHRGCVSIQAIDAHDDVRKGKRKRRRIRRDSLQGVSHFFAVIAMDWTRKGAHLLMGGRLSHRGPCSSHLSSFAPKIAFGTHLLKTTVRGWKLLCLGKGPLSCRLFGAIDIDHQPVLSLAIPKSTRRT